MVTLTMCDTTRQAEVVAGVAVVTSCCCACCLYLGGVVDPHEAEARAVAVRPLEVLPHIQREGAAAGARDESLLLSRPLLCRFRRPWYTHVVEGPVEVSGDADLVEVHGLPHLGDVPAQVPLPPRVVQRLEGRWGKRGRATSVSG